MINFFTLPEALQYIIIIFNLSVLILNIYCFISCLILKTKKEYLISNTLLMIISSAIFVILVSANFSHRSHNKIFPLISQLCSEYTLPIIAAIISIAVFSAFAFHSINISRKNHITTASIKEAMDMLPAGLCYHKPDGLPKLINYRMESLCRLITGEALFDANEFWKRLSQGFVIYGNRVLQSGNNPIIILADSTAVSFKRETVEISGESLFEIRATDITKQYALNLELQEYNNELRSLNRRLQEYGENVTDITREKEILSAKVSIHDLLGKALLITKRFIENEGSDISRQELIETWEAAIYLFSGGFIEEQEENSLDELYDAAKIMGISLKINGHIPKDNNVLRFLMGGARECLTNAVHHAGATRLTVNIFYNYYYTVIEYTNDGEAPKAPVCEGGGLSFLRQIVEKDGGTMEVISYPRFVLRLKILSKEVYRNV